MKILLLARRLCCALLVSAAGAGGTMAAAGPVQFSVDLNIEGTYTGSALVVTTPLRRHLLLGATRQELDAGDNAAADFIQSLAKGDANAVRSHWDGAVAAAGSASPAARESTGELPLSGYATLMAGFRDVGVLGRVPSDDGELVLFRATSAGVPIVRAFRMRASAGQWRFSAVNISKHTADVFLINCFDGIGNAQDLAARVARAAAKPKAPDVYHRLAIHARGAELLLPGRRLDGINVPTVETSAPLVARIVSARMLLLGNEQVDDMRRLLSKESFQRFERWRRTIDAESARQLAQAQMQPKRAAFIAALGSAQLLFYVNGNDVLAHSAGEVAYEYVAGPAEQPKVVNVLQHSILDEFLRTHPDLPKLIGLPRGS